MKNFSLFILLCFSFSTSAQFSLVWSDEFDAATLNTDIWTAEIGTGNSGWGNWEEQYYTSNAANLRLDTGYLHITALKQPYNGSDYTSARIKTQGKYSFQYGKIEARIKLPNGKGLWPAFWLLGSNITSVSWPQCGEIDVMEHVNHSPFANGTMHYNDNGHTYTGSQVLCDVSEFQTYSIEWDSTWIRWFLNDELFHEEYIFNGTASREEFHKPFFILLNMAVGGNWPGPPDASTAFPAEMLVDYVRVYQENVVSTKDLPELSGRIYPNPAKDKIFLENTDYPYFQIISSVGNTQKEGLLRNASIDISELAQGLYFIILHDEEGHRFYKRFVKN